MTDKPITRQRRDIVDRLQDVTGFIRFETNRSDAAGSLPEEAAFEIKRLRASLDAISAAVPHYSYVQIKGAGENQQWLAGSPYDRGIEEGYRRLQALCDEYREGAIPAAMQVPRDDR